MKSVMISIKPRWCELIANGKKTVEVRKTRPKIEIPFKVYIYCTQARNPIRDSGRIIMYEDDLALINRWGRGKLVENPCGAMMEGEFFLNSKVIGEFICDSIFMIWDGYMGNLGDDCLTFEERENYLKGNNGYGWHISDLVIYDEPKELSEFVVVDKEAIQQCEYRKQSYYAFTDTGYIKNGFRCEKKDDWCFGGCKRKVLTKPPQSWCYCDELEE